MQCAKCRSNNREGRKFCGECGAPLAVACAACSFLNEPGEKYCGGCGQALTPAKSPPAAAPVATTSEAASAPEAYTPKHLAEKILLSKGSLEGERKQVTILFADMKGSTELLADRDPEEARGLLDPVLERMMEAVHHYEGTVNQVMGDGIMALFGAPLAHEDHAVRACYAALRMQETVRRYAEEVERTARAKIAIRVGMNSGEVVVRSIGSDLNMDYTAVGQSTHLAARMEQMALPGTIVLTGDTRRLAEGHVQAKSLGMVTPRGFSTPLEAFELTGAAKAKTRLQLVAPGGLTPFVGREAEVSVLQGALVQVLLGGGRLLALVGDTGVGKSRVCHEFVTGERVRACRVLHATGLSFGRSTPFLPVVGLLRAYFGLDEHEAPEKVREVVTARVAAHPPLEGYLPAFLQLFDLAATDADWQALAPSQRRERTLDALGQLVVLESKLQPLILVMENLQWIDSETQAVLDRFVELLPTTRMLLIITHRPEFRDPWIGRAEATQVRLSPLATAAGRQMLDALLGTDPTLESLKELLVRQTQGNPLFLEESINALVETGALAGERGAYRLARKMQSIQVPSTVRAVLAARIDRLGPDDKRLLQSVAVVGTDVQFELLRALADMSEDALRQALTHLQQAEFIAETQLFPDLAFGLKHVLTQEVAYAGLLHERKRLLHARILNALESLWPERLHEQVERLAYHAARGEVWPKATQYYREAGLKAAALSANREAVECFEQSLQALAKLPESREAVEQAIDIRVAMRPSYLQLGELERVLTISREAEALTEKIGDEPRLARVLAYLTNYHYLKGAPTVALEYGERCLAIAAKTGDASLRTLTERYMGHCHQALGHYRQAEQILRDNAQGLEAVAERDLNQTISYVAATAWRALALAELGEFDPAYLQVDRAQHAAEASHHAYSQAMAATMNGFALMRQGLFERAIPTLERALELCTQKSLAVWRPIPSAVLGAILAAEGRLADGLRLLEDGVRLTEELGVNAYLSLWVSHLAEGRLLADGPAAARETAQRALDLATRFGERGHQAWALRLFGEIASRDGDAGAGEAVARYREALALASELGMRPLAAHCQFGLGRALRRAGDSAGAVEQLTAATEGFWQSDMRRWLKQAELELTGLGQLFIVGRDNPGLFEHLRQSFAEDRTITVILDRRTGERQMRAALGVAGSN
ncbi:MAG: adenylate/guanylate cyclase domain-containing protein [Candidatus Rokuibacteriota bacterium]